MVRKNQAQVFRAKLIRFAVFRARFENANRALYSAGAAKSIRPFPSWQLALAWDGDFAFGCHDPPGANRISSLAYG